MDYLFKNEHLTNLCFHQEREPENSEVFGRIIEILIKSYSVNAFAKFLLGKIYSTYSKIQDDNTCFLRFPFGVTYPSSYYHALQKLDQTFSQYEKLASTYDLLHDDYSRDMFIQLLTYRILGGRYVKLTTNNVTYWELLRESQNYVIHKDVIPTGFFIDGTEFNLDLCFWKYKNNQFKAYCHPVAILFAFLLEQYAYKQNNDLSLSVKEGDYVIDGGACWGDSALYFATLAGSSGKVFSFEFLPFNLAVLNKNTTLNYDLADRITVVPSALWERSGDILEYNANGPGTSVGIGGTEKVATISIDDFVSQSQLPKVDFIKMDIEGAELSALKGAENTLRRFKPRLAICLYHKPDDYIDIPEYLNSLNLGYQFYLDHFSIHLEETVLFAI